MAKSEPLRACVACGATQSEVAFREHQVDVVRCRGCGHLYSTHPVPQHYDDYFGDEVGEDEQFWWDAAHGAMYRSFARRVLAGRPNRST